MNAEIIHGNALAILRKIEKESINCCITSPPYFGLRDYDHKMQIGLENTPKKYINKLVKVFRELRRCLRKDGTLWINIGDSYVSSCKKTDGSWHGYREYRENRAKRLAPGNIPGLKRKDLIGIPWMLAFALREDGWYLRQDIIWDKSNPMPESVTDRCSKSHEYIFLLSKQRKYYFDSDSIKVPATPAHMTRRRQCLDGQSGSTRAIGKNNGPMKCVGGNMVNRKSVWKVSTARSTNIHFAVFPEKLIEPCVLAGCPEGGIVIDPFMGSGTTGIVSLRSRRRFIGIELNKEYLALAKARIKPLLIQPQFDFTEDSK